jgi:hypothetical protein
MEIQDRRLGGHGDPPWSDPGIKRRESEECSGRGAGVGIVEKD